MLGSTSVPQRKSTPSTRQAIVHDRGTEVRNVEKLLTFALDGDEYAIAIRSVQEIVALGHITPLPDSPSEVLGVMSLHGSAIPVLHMRARLAARGAAATVSPPAAASVVVVLRAGERRVGIVVDRVLDVTEMSTDAMQPQPALDRLQRSPLIRGLLTCGDRICVLLEVATLLKEDAAIATPIHDPDGALRPGEQT